VKKLAIVVYIVEPAHLIKNHAWDVDLIIMIKNKKENQNGVARFVNVALN